MIWLTTTSSLISSDLSLARLNVGHHVLSKGGALGWVKTTVMRYHILPPRKTSNTAFLFLSFKHRGHDVRGCHGLFCYEMMLTVFSNTSEFPRLPSFLKVHIFWWTHLWEYGRRSYSIYSSLSQTSKRSWIETAFRATSRASHSTSHLKPTGTLR